VCVRKEKEKENKEKDHFTWVNKFLHCQNMDTHYSAGVGE
jgi:hypothetical protein